LFYPHSALALLGPATHRPRSLGDSPAPALAPSPAALATPLAPPTSRPRPTPGSARRTAVTLDALRLLLVRLGLGKGEDTGWPIQDILSLFCVCVRINHPFTTPANSHSHYCNTIARILRHMYIYIAGLTRCDFSSPALAWEQGKDTGVNQSITNPHKATHGQGEADPSATSRVANPAS